MTARDITPMEVQTPYYEDTTRISNSAIGWFINGGPTYFHNKLTGVIPNESSSAMSRGTAIHMYLLQPEEFQKTYKVWTGAKPSSDKQEQFCRELANSLEIEPNKAILEAYRKVYSTTGQTDDKVLEKGLKIALELKEYIEYIKNPEYELISPYLANMLSKIKDNIESHKLANVLLNPKKGKTFHEFHINWYYLNVRCKSLLDSVHFDTQKKVVTLMDIKTTTKLMHFEDSVNQYDYQRQLIFYLKAIKYYLLHHVGSNPDEWTYKVYIIAVDGTETGQIRVFSFEVDKLSANKEKSINDALNRIKWHTDNNLWEHTKEYYEGDGSETLNL